jgi:hypothetical protein
MFKHNLKINNDNNLRTDKISFFLLSEKENNVGRRRSIFAFSKNGVDRAARQRYRSGDDSMQPWLAGRQSGGLSFCSKADAPRP